MKFPERYWRKFEFPSMEKLNGVLDAIEYHVQRTRSLTGAGQIFADPGVNMEHWAAAIRTTGIFNDVQEALDFNLTSIIDTKLPLYTVAPGYLENIVKADFYIPEYNDFADTSQFITNITKMQDYEEAGGGVLFFHAGRYQFVKKIEVYNHVSFIGESNGGTIFDLGPRNGLYPVIPSIEIQQYSHEINAPALIANINFDNIAFNAIKGQSMIIYQCNFRYNFLYPFHMDEAMGVIESQDFSDANPLPVRVQRCTFHVGENIDPGSIIVWINNRIPIYNKFGGMMVEDVIVRRESEDEKWFRHGILSGVDATWIRIKHCEIHSYDEAVKVLNGNLYIEKGGFYRDFDRSTLVEDLYESAG